MSHRATPSRVRFLAAGLSALGLVACGTSFDPPSEVQSLRILGVQKDKPYAAPGDVVTLNLLWYDGAETEPDVEPREIQRAWFSGCFNPPGDLYFGCFEALQGAQATASMPDPASLLNFGVGDTFEVKIPDDIISSRPPPVDPRQPRYGLAIVFFAACAGLLGPADPSQAGGFPLSCLDEEGDPLGSDDFVAGYSSIYVYEGFTNQNAVITGFELDGDKVDPDCIGTDCIGIDERFEPDHDNLPTLAACEDDGEDTCPAIQMRPLIDPTSAEVDSIAATAYARTLQEQMWINYHVSAGSVKSSVRLYNDATTGINEDFGTEFYAPKATGPIKIWAVVRDNRGGTNWVRVSALVE